MSRAGRGFAPLRKDIYFDARQVEILEALRALAPFGKPSFTALVLHAVDSFIQAELAKPGVSAAVEKHLRDQRQPVVKLRAIEK